jgi:Methyltransferase domain
MSIKLERWMIRKALRRAANAIGYDVHRFSNDEWRWSYHIDDYYPVDPVPRWGYGKPPHPQITEALARRRSEYSETLSAFAQHLDVMTSVPSRGVVEAGTPYWRNDWFENLDPISLMGMLLTKKPARYFEIGSGNSTKFARHAIETAQLRTKLSSWDPEPRASIDALCDNVIRRRLEDCDLAVFDELEAGDILFFDGSHRAFTNSDVTVFFLDLMPRLKPGVNVHVHDITLPWDYLPEWKKRLYSEQYILAAMLICPQPFFKVLLPNFFVSKDQSLGPQVQTLVKPLGCVAQGWSFWLEIA